jgi:hypothetical protein
MKRYLLILMALALLALPVMVGAQETVIPPEAHWTPTPPAQQAVNMAQLAQILLQKGVITSQEYAQLTQPQSAMSAQPNSATAWQPNAGYRTGR